MDLADLQELSEPFGPQDVEWRIGQSGKKGDGSIWAKAFAYITNRAIMQRLDDVVGPENWRNEYQEWHGTNTLCGIAIRVNGEWVTKWDGSEAPETEPVKGALSAAMKRAAVQWGIGRYLYDLPEGWCKIVEKGTKGALYASGQTKEKEKYHFYWLPPELPKWAVPTETGEVPTDADKADAEKFISSSVFTEPERVKMRAALKRLDSREKFQQKLIKIKQEAAKRMVPKPGVPAEEAA